MSAPRTGTGTILDFLGGSPMSQDDAPPFRDGEPAKHELGVAYIGPWERYGDGFHEHTRRCARALALTGCPTHLRSAGKTIMLGAPRDLPKEIAPLLTESVSAYSFQIYQVVLTASLANSLTTHRYMTPSELEVVNSRKIIYSVWERDRIDKYTADALNRVGQVWTACEANKAMLVRCGVLAEKIRIVPIPFFPNDPMYALRSTTRRNGVPRFYHIGKWEPRKAQEKIVEAFMLAFRPDEATLLLKCSTLVRDVGGYSSGPHSHINELVKRHDIQGKGWTSANWEQSIEVVRKMLTDEEMVRLHHFGDIYVSLSRGEGFDMPAFDAKLAGNILVYTPSGGPQSFAGGDDFEVQTRGMSIPCHEMYGWEADARYLDFPIEEASRSMHLAAQAVRAGRASHTLMDRFTAKRVGEDMLGYLREIAEPYRREPKP